MLNRLRRRVAERRVRRLVARRVRDSGVDVDGLLALARESFVQLQAAWDAADLQRLSAFTTPPLLADLRQQLAERGPLPNHTEVLLLNAQLMGVEELREAFVASVEFSGVIRERDDCDASPFRELWLLAQPKDEGPRWRIAGVQSLC